MENKSWYLDNDETGKYIVVELTPEMELEAQNQGYTLYDVKEECEAVRDKLNN